MKRVRALVVDDSPKVVRAVESFLKSLDHDFDVASNQEQAREILRAAAEDGRYEYVLLDLHMPFGDGDPARVQTGENLLAEIRGNPAFDRVAVIVMSAHVAGGPDRAVDMMKLGADDVVAKPFADEGKTLDSVILATMERRQKSGGDRVPFEGGELAHCGDHIELCGIAIIGDQNFEDSMTLLSELARQRLPEGVYAVCRPKDLAELIGSDTTAVHNSISLLRNNIQERLLKELNLSVGKQDVIESISGGGYRLRAWIDAAGSGWGEPETEPARIIDVDGTILNERQVWALETMQSGQAVRLKDLMTQSSQSRSTCQRDLRRLRELGLAISDEGVHLLTDKGRESLAVKQ